MGTGTRALELSDLSSPAYPDIDQLTVGGASPGPTPSSLSPGGARSRTAPPKHSGVAENSSLRCCPSPTPWRVLCPPSRHCPAERVPHCIPPADPRCTGGRAAGGVDKLPGGEPLRRAQAGLNPAHSPRYARQVGFCPLLCPYTEGGYCCGRGALRTLRRAEGLGAGRCPDTRRQRLWAHAFVRTSRRQSRRWMVAQT